ncbi:hypothetical protein QC756_03875 [Sinorhizobium meliloti]|uniref:hypothetical protein n=1 Tax=Rhizobium meliloti TaxID=382 RepID=UPI000FD83986|nr:hypothetical protein [Sinorhizobium meliloti]RVK26612.1 hypothetical protein CN156_20885 [Sinorhizobium meliloti]WGI75022.1 hypothetical protein QC756_03875 [Sinorhizobium meliloti]
MSNKDSIIPAALANTPEAEIQALKDYLESDEGMECASYLEMDFISLQEEIDVRSIVNDAKNANDVVAQLDSAIDYAEGIAFTLRKVREDYVDALGVPEALKEVVASLQKAHSKSMVNALRHGLELMSNSHRKMNRELRESLVALGMPRSFSGRAINTYCRASTGDWTRKLLEDASGLTATKQHVR